MADNDTELLPAKYRTGHTDLELLEAIDRTHPAGRLPVISPVMSAAPDIGAAMPGSDITARGRLPQQIGGAQPALPTISAREQRRLPDISPGVQPGSSAFYQNRLTKLETPGEAPTSTLGKIGHTLSRIGNVALDIGAPAIAMDIPGTDMFKRAEIAGTERKLAQSKQAEETAAERQATERESVRHHEETEAETANKNTAGLAEHGLTRDANGNIVADPTSQVYQKNQLAMETVKNVQVYRQAQQDLIEAREEVERSKLDPNSPAFKQAQMKLAMAQEAHRVAAQNLALHEQEFANKKEEQEFVKPTGQAGSRGSAARSVLDLYDAPGKPGLESLVRANAKEMGPIMGRLNRGEIALGDVDPKIAELYGAMKSFYALQPAVHGFRSAEFVKDLETAIGTLERDPEAFIAGMKGLRPTLESVAKEGVTYHRRIKEGGPATATAPKTEEGEGGEKKKKLPF